MRHFGHSDEKLTETGVAGLVDLTIYSAEESKGRFYLCCYSKVIIPEIIRALTMVRWYRRGDFQTGKLSNIWTDLENFQRDWEGAVFHYVKKKKKKFLKTMITIADKLCSYKMAARTVMYKNMKYSLGSERC